MNAASEARGLFVTATDTGAGKTFVSCALALALRALGRDVGVMKPVATGCRRLADGTLVSADAEALVAAAGASDPSGLVTPAAFEAPLAPTAAAAREGRGGADVAQILAAYAELLRRHETMIVEGIGGLLVPLAGRYTVRDLARDMACPVLIVSFNRLGTISHTALTVESARAAGLDVRGVVLNSPPGLGADESSQTNAEEIERLVNVRVLARLGTLEDAAAAARLPVRAVARTQTGTFDEEVVAVLFGPSRRAPT